MFKITIKKCNNKHFKGNNALAVTYETTDTDKNKLFSRNK